MKDIVASLKPYYYYLICEGVKEYEVRKKAPKAEDWSRKVNFYMSKDEKSFAKIPKEFKEKYRKHFGKVGLRVIVDWIDILECDSNSHLYFSLNGTCLSQEEIRDYCNGQDLSAWHIYDKLILDKPKELSEFKKIHRECWYADLGLAKRDCPECKNAGCFIQRPPQSWYYVEEK